MRLRILLQLAKDRRTLQFFAHAGALRINRLPPSGSIFLVEKLGNRNRGEVRITQELRAVEEGAPEALDGKVDRFGRTALHLGEIVALENIQQLDQDDATGGRWRRADDFKSAIASAHGLPLFDFIVGQIVYRDQTSA